MMGYVVSPFISTFAFLFLRHAANTEQLPDECFYTDPKVFFYAFRSYKLQVSLYLISYAAKNHQFIRCRSWHPQVSRRFEFSLDRYTAAGICQIGQELLSAPAAQDRP